MLKRSNGEGGWTLDPIMVRDVTHKIGKDGWEISMEAVEMVMLEAEHILSQHGEPVAWRVRVKEDDPEEWSLMPAGAGADYLGRDGFEVQPLYTSPPSPAPFDMEGAESCPVCAKAFKAGDLCATDIELGTCHAACLEGSPTVDLETGEPSNGPIATYPYEPNPLPSPDIEKAVEAMYAERGRIEKAWCPWGELPDYAKDKWRRALTAALPYLRGGAESFQDRVQPWMMACFGPEISADKLERSDRFIEEALELIQAGDYPKERVLALVDYVYDRDQGDINQEVGGVMVTLAAHCLANGVDMHASGEAELARVWTKIDKIRAKQKAKPTGSALPTSPSPDPEEE